MPSYPSTFQTPDGKGSAIHPLLLALYYTSPALVKAVLASTTDDKTLSHAVKKTWSSLGAGGDKSAKAVWDLIGEAMLVPADPAELLSQLCDLFDAELNDAAANAVGLKSRVTIEAGARVKDGQISDDYKIVVSLPLRPSLEGETLQSLLAQNYATATIDYMFPDDIEPADAQKFQRIAGKFHEGVIIHLQRYRYDFNLRANAKIYDRVEFPEHIAGKDLVNFADVDSAKLIGTCSLDLVAVLTHNDENGYGLLLRPDAKGPWWKCCDSNSSVPVETSIESAFGGDIDQDIAYMLFYKVSGGGDGGLAGMARRVSTRLSVKGQAPLATAALSNAPAAKSADEPKSQGCCTII